MDDDYAELVLSVVERIPPGQVATYGDIAEIVGRGGPRQVGHVMALLGRRSAVVARRTRRWAACPQPRGARFETASSRKTPLKGDRVDMERARFRIDRGRQLRSRATRAVIRNSCRDTTSRQGSHCAVIYDRLRTLLQVVGVVVSATPQNFAWA